MTKSEYIEAFEKQNAKIKQNSELTEKLTAKISELETLVKNTIAKREKDFLDE